MLMARIYPREKKIVWAVSIFLGAALATTAILNYLYLQTTLIFETDQLVFLSLIVAIFPPSIVDLIDNRWKSSIDKNIPEFLRELSEAGRTGMTITRALEMASRRRYGPLSAELKRVTVRLSWGGDLEEALREFGERIDTKLAKRTATIISEINRSGGEIRDVLDIVSRHIGELQTIDDERNSQLRMYVIIIYIAFFIFLVIDFLLLKTLFARFEELKTMTTETGTGGILLPGGLSLKSIERVMFHMAAIEGFLGGLVAGKMGEKSIGAGLKHSLILLIITFVAFYIFIWR